MPWAKTSSTLNRYKSSGSSVRSSRVLKPQTPVPGMAVRVVASKHREIANKENKKPAVVVVEHENEKKKTTKLRSINSKVDTYRHQLYSQTGIRWCKQGQSNFYFAFLLQTGEASFAVLHLGAATPETSLARSYPSHASTAWGPS